MILSLLFILQSLSEFWFMGIDSYAFLVGKLESFVLMGCQWLELTTRFNFFLDYWWILLLFFDCIISSSILLCGWILSWFFDSVAKINCYVYVNLCFHFQWIIQSIHKGLCLWISVANLQVKFGCRPGGAGGLGLASLWVGCPRFSKVSAMAVSTGYHKGNTMGDSRMTPSGKGQEHPQ